MKQKSTFKQSKERGTLYLDGYREPDPFFAKNEKKLKKENDKHN